jgi:cytochrome c oxidase subunit 3
MANVMSVQREKIHPHKFTMWVAIGSIIMMFAGLTSAYIVKRSQAGWAMIELPGIFWLSTLTILASSVTMYLSVKSFRDRNHPRYKQLLLATAFLGAAFLIMQVVGFMQYKDMDIRLVGAGSNASYSFILAIAGLHGLHVVGGVVALVIITFRALRSRHKSYSSVPVEILATYWHFVDILWIYLILFINWMR